MGFYAPPVVRGDFSCSGDDFFVTIEGHRHKREDPLSLHRLLTYTTPAPLLTKAGKVAKRQPTPHKDPPGHFYAAQLLHYGLKPRKTKDAAKRQLLAEYATSGRFSVPKHILKLEESLQEEYRQANQVAKKKYEEDKRVEEAEKRAQHEELQRQRDAIMQEFYDLGPQDSSESEDNISRAHLHDAIASLSKERLRQILVQLVNDIPAVEQAVREEVGNPHLSGDGGGTTRASGGKGKSKAKAHKLAWKELEGEFEIVAPYLSEQWSDCTQSMTLKVCPSSTKSHLWASFDFGVVSGVLRSTDRPSTTTGVSCPFLWRGRESGEGEMSFGQRNKGSIVFLGSGKIKGRMEWMGGFDFVGVDTNRKNVVWSKSVKGWKATWRGINERSYEVERVSRWGRGYARDPLPDKPSLSDTSGGALGDNEDEGSDIDYDSDMDVAY